LETAVIHRASWHLPLVARPIVASPETIPNRRLQPACLGLRRQIPQSGRRRRFRLQPASPNPPPAWRQPETSLETSLTAPARTSDLRPSPAPAARKSQTVYRKRPGVIILLKVIGIDWKSLETAVIHRALWHLPLVARPIVVPPETVPNRRLQPSCLGLRRQIPPSGRRHRFRLQPASPNPPPASRQPETSLETSLSAPARTSDPQPSPAPAARKSQFIYRTPPRVHHFFKSDWN